MIDLVFGRREREHVEGGLRRHLNADELNPRVETVELVFIGASIYGYKNDIMGRCIVEGIQDQRRRGILDITSSLG